MKYKSYKNSAEEYATGLNVELLSSDDNISARNTNRPIANLYENQESNYNLIQTLLKTVYGNSNGIVPDVLEEFSPETFSVGSFKNSTTDYFLRLPTGVMFLSKKLEEDLTNNNSNPFLKKGDYKYKDNKHKEDFLQDISKSYVIENKPEINLYERELANLIALDLTDLTNDIKIYQDLIPLTIKVGVTDSDNNIKYEANGSPMYLTDDNSKVLYKAEDGKGNFSILDGNALATINKQTCSSIYANVINSETQRLNEEVIKHTVVYKESLRVVDVGFGNGEYTTDIDNALKLKDANGNIKQKTGYYMNVVRNTPQDDEIVWLPNKQQNANWEIFLPAYEMGSKYTTININIKNKTNNIEENLSFSFDDNIDYSSMNNNLFMEFNTNSRYFTIEKIQKNNYNGLPVIGSRVTAKSSTLSANDYEIVITYNTIYANGDPDSGFISDYITNIPYGRIEKKDNGKEETVGVKINPKEEQKYYTDIFELTNSFLGYFSSSFVNINNIYNYLNLETILKMPKNIQSGVSYYVYYDLNGDLNNQLNEEYDKTSRFFITNLDKTESNLVKLFELQFSLNNKLPANYEVSYVKSFFDPLDRRMISTKRAELNSLLSTTRTELGNYVHIKDADGNREIEITEKFGTSDDEQLRITSPISRIVDVKSLQETSKVENKWPEDNWTDSKNGDTPSDFFEEPFEVLNTALSENDPAFRKYYTHKDNENKGIIIDKNKGIKIFNNDSGNTDGKKSYSNYKPIEIISKYGNINLLTTNNNNARINIRNNNDSENNIVDILGITRVRSSNNGQLVVRKIGDIDNTGNTANIVFSIGNSYSKDDKTALNPNTITNLMAGSILYYSGKTGEVDKDSSKDYNIIPDNRMFGIKLARAGEKEAYDTDEVLTIRNSNCNDGTDKKEATRKTTASFKTNIVPSVNDTFIGFPIGSRTYSNIDYYITYPKYDNITKAVKSGGNSSEYINNEGRWCAAFIKDAYFGTLTLSDRTSDVNNLDFRGGVLNLGNSNIYDVSRIFINRTSGMLNFDNFDSSENTIYSNSKTSDDAYFKFVLNRTLGGNNENVESESNIDYCSAIFKTSGVGIGKNLDVLRQVFVNNHSESSTEDNSSLVVKGQSVLNGELIIGKNAETVNDTNETNYITRNTSDKYKDYNEEYFEELTTEKNRSKNSLGNYIYSEKEKFLNTLVNNGRTHLKGALTLDGEFTEKAIFNKTLTINNNKYAHYKYNDMGESLDEYYCPVKDERRTNKIVTDNYHTSSKDIPRNNVSFDVVSGRIIFGSECTVDSDCDDRSDLLLYGSQWIKRRLSISEDGDVLINTNMKYEKLVDGVTQKSSPVLYVDGASQFTGDIVFGHTLREYKDGSETFKLLGVNKIEKNVNVLENTIKAIFWGANKETSLNNWMSDFDFHGRTWFDNCVKIGCDKSDVRFTDSYDNANGNNGKLEILGANNTDYALKVRGQVTFVDGLDSSQSANSIFLNAEKDSKTASLSLNSKDKNGNYTGEAILFGSDKATIGGTNNSTITMSNSELEINGNNSKAYFSDDSVKVSSKNGKSATVGLLSLTSSESKMVGGNAATNLTLATGTATLTGNTNSDLTLTTNSAVLKSNTTVNLTLDANSATLKSSATTNLSLASGTATLTGNTNSDLTLTTNSAVLKSSATTNLNLEAGTATLTGNTNSDLTLTTNSAVLKSSDKTNLTLGEKTVTLKGNENSIEMGSNTITLTANTVTATLDKNGFNSSNILTSSIKSSSGTDAISVSNTSVNAKLNTKVSGTLEVTKKATFSGEVDFANTSYCYINTSGQLVVYGYTVTIG